MYILRYIREIDSPRTEFCETSEYLEKRLKNLYSEWAHRDRGKTQGPPKKWIDSIQIFESCPVPDNIRDDALASAQKWYDEISVKCKASDEAETERQEREEYARLHAKYGVPEGDLLDGPIIKHFRD